MIHQAIGIGRVAVATPAPDLPDQLELAQNESREKKDRQTDSRRGKRGEDRRSRWVGALPKVLTQGQ